MMQLKKAEAKISVRFSRHRKNGRVGFPLIALAYSVLFLSSALGQADRPREFAKGALKRFDELPAGRFRTQLEGLPPQARGRALGWLQDLHFPAEDTASMQVDSSGGVCYACKFGHAHVDPVPAPAEAGPGTSQAAVPVEPFPDGLKFHSRPGLTKRIYINFVGQTVSGTAWNTSLGRTSITALPFSTDADTTTFNDAEQAAIKRIWQRMAEDYAPFDIDVTTERPTTVNNTTAIVLITRNTDSTGAPNPASAAGGVAYVNVFGAFNFISTYSPAWVYHNNLANSESYIAEAASHEIGHNLGLSHDGTTTQDYYGGHGGFSDPISWGPLMGTGYDRNVSQWSRGEYLNANNTQDDLATIASKTGYRTDDHGNTQGTARPLVISGGTTITSTTPENDPTDLTPSNKGVIERNTDVDVFSFVTGSGTVQLNVNPWIQPAGTRGGNLDILLELYNSSGQLITSANPSSQTTASISTTLAQGQYFLHVRNSSTGTPLATSPSGYTSYGSIGQYFISGTVVDPGSFVVAPVAESQSSDLDQAGQLTHTFTISYTDNAAINVATLGTGDIRVTGPGGYDQIATFVSVDVATNGTPRRATYSVAPAGGGAWSAVHNGTYSISMVAGQVLDTENASVPAGTLGQFQVAVPVPLFTANMSTDPGWTLGTNWSFGKPAYGSNGSNGPNAGFTGDNVIGHSMSTNYANSLAMAYVTTPTITNAGSSPSLTLRFRRWLGLSRSDTATLQVSGNNGATWVTLWSTTAAVGDTSWLSMQYPLPAAIIGSTQIRFRWGLSSNKNTSAIGWHIDDVELLGGGAVDAAPPSATLSVANITSAGSPTHSCAITYTDATAVLRSSVDPTDLLVVGPAGPLSPLVIETSGVDLSSNGTPLSGNYSIAAPGGTWDPADSGQYTITLQDGAVEDTLGNVAGEQILGSFTVAISSLTPGLLEVSGPGDFISSGNAGGSFSPSSILYTLSNTGQSPLNWTAAKTQNWVSLDTTSGTLAAGASTQITASLNPAATSLAVGSYSDTISFSNTSNNNGNTTREVGLTVNPIPVAITLGPLSQTYDGSTKPITVTTSPSPRAFAISYDGSPTAPTAAGNYPVTVTITEPNHVGSAAATLLIAKAPQSLSFSPLPAVTLGAAPFVIPASASSGLPVTLSSLNPTIATVSENLVTLMGAGTTTITASQPGDANFHPATDIPQLLIVRSVYESWATSSFGNPLSDPLPEADPDHDGLNNLQEFAFGTDPTVSSPGPLSYTAGNLTSSGAPILASEDGVFHIIFARRKDHAAAGLIYTPLFSADLSPDWMASTDAPVTEAGNSIIDAVKVPFPTTVPTSNGPMEPKFSRIKVSLSPP
jgi:hypothetical protein